MLNLASSPGSLIFSTYARVEGSLVHAKSHELRYPIELYNIHGCHGSRGDVTHVILRTRLPLFSRVR